MKAMNGILKTSASIWLLELFFLMSMVACEKSEKETGYQPEFVYQADSQNPNIVSFSNISKGDYLYVEWDFGNGEKTDKETDKTRVYQAYYPNKGEYTVTLKLWGPLNTPSDTKTFSQHIVIAQDATPDLNGVLIWSDEFNGSSLNSNSWTYETGSGGWGNNELQNYTSGDNVHFENGNLVITARKVNEDKTAGSYTSSRIVTWRKKEFQYGRVEVRAKLPSGTGVWPAIWMLGTNMDVAGWPACGEIDIMEYVGYQPNTVHMAVHTTSGYGDNCSKFQKTLSSCEEEFHIYGLIWTSEKLEFYIDVPQNVIFTYNPQVKTPENWPFDKPQFILLNLAVGGNWGGAQGIDNSIFPQTMVVDYVRVYQLEE